MDGGRHDESTGVREARVRPPAAAVICYAVGEIPITVAMVLIGLLALFFYNSVMGLAGVLVGVGISSGLVFDALVDPYIGFYSDTSNHKFGRRHIFMLVGGIAMGPCFALLFSPPRGLGNAGLFAWLLCFSILFRFMSALYRIPYLSLGAEISDDYHERTRVIAIRALFGLAGMLAAAGLSFVLFFPASANGADSKLNYANYPPLGVFFGSILTIASLVAVFGTRQFAAGRGATQGIRSAREFFRGFAVAFANRSFRRLVISATLFFLAVVANATLAIHYFTWYARVTESRAVSGIQIGFYVGAVAGVVVWMRLARRREKRSLYLVGMLGTAAVLAAASLLIGPGHLFGTGNVRILMLGHALAGIFSSTLWVVPSAMLADIADEDELITGLRREGVFFGILNFGEKVAAGLAILMTGTLLNFFVRLEPGASLQTSQVVTKIGLLYGLLPGVLAGIAALLIAGYRLDAQSVESIQRKLASRKTPQPAPGEKTVTV